MTRIWLVLAAVLVALIVAGCRQQPTEQPRGDQASPPSDGATQKASVEGEGADYAPALDPADFVDEVTNPYWPLRPGDRWVYEETGEGESYTVEVVVLDEKKDIQGIQATVVRDIVRSGDTTVEDTFDWYAQEKDGTVWYLGEDTKEFENGKVVTTEGSWEYGVDGAQPGVIMQANPRPGGRYWQEYYAGEAEDQARVISFTGAASVPFGEFQDLLVTEESSPLEPKLRERKYYMRGLGLVREEVVSGGEGEAVLTSYRSK